MLNKFKKNKKVYFITGLGVLGIAAFTAILSNTTQAVSPDRPEEFIVVNSEKGRLWSGNADKVNEVLTLEKGHQYPLYFRLPTRKAEIQLLVQAGPRLSTSVCSGAAVERLLQSGEQVRVLGNDYATLENGLKYGFHRVELVDHPGTIYWVSHQG